ncbi:hypothetical protein XENOCAPTIV_029565 [Xenoophorus captivus]|uniref:Uncharacterized protein n=1 Tax=Xenoophorus captivus TaxID=1517983 RepID=A0ABV0RBB2_9TELE
MATAMGGCINNRGTEHVPPELYASSLPWDLGKALPEVEVEYICDRGLHQAFPADPRYKLVHAKSVQLPLPAHPNQTMDKLFIIYLLCLENKPTRSERLASHQYTSC